MEKPRILIILGPTASGKSALAVEAAKRFNGEIISADSRQVYKGLNIGTGKITREEMDGIPHHLLDVADPQSVFAVTDFKEQAEIAIDEIIARGKLPIICGGTGLYIDTLVFNLEIPEVPPNPELRDKLSDKSASELFKLLSEKDPARAESVDPQNPRRLVRALEIAEALGKVPPKIYAPEKYDPIFIGIKTDPEELKKKIADRLTLRLKQGMIEEAQRLHSEGLSFERMESLGLEYKYLALYLQGKISREDMEKELLQAIVDYSKRQMTWFRKNDRIVWLNPLEILPRLEALFAPR